MQHQRYVLVALVALIVAGARSASAQPRDDVAAAKAHYAKGTRLYEVGEYRQALSEFKEAHVAKPDPAFLFNIAQCHRQLGELEEAVVMYKRYLAASPRAVNRAEVEKRIGDIESELAAAKANNAAIQGAPAAEPRVVAPTSMAAVSAPPVAPTGQLVATAPSAETAGTLREPSGSSLRFWRWVGVGVTVALAGAATGTGMSASSKYDDLKGSCGNTTAGCTGSQIDSVKSRALLTNVLWGAAGVAAVATGLMFYLSPSAAGAQVAWSF